MRIIAVLLVLLVITLPSGCITTKEKEPESHQITKGKEELVKNKTPPSWKTWEECRQQGNSLSTCDQTKSGTVPSLGDLDAIPEEKVPPEEVDAIPSSTIPKKSENYPKDNRVFNTIYDRSQRPFR